MARRSTLPVERRQDWCLCGQLSQRYKDDGNSGVTVRICMIRGRAPAGRSRVAMQPRLAFKKVGRASGLGGSGTVRFVWRCDTSPSTALTLNGLGDASVVAISWEPSSKRAFQSIDIVGLYKRHGSGHRPIVTSRHVLRLHLCVTSPPIPNHRATQLFRSLNTLCE